MYFAAAICLIWGFSMHLVPEIDPGHFGYIVLVGAGLLLLFLILSIREVMGSPFISMREQRMWILGLILLNIAVGLAYVLAGRERVVGSS
jgi:hypothetical protein